MAVPISTFQSMVTQASQKVFLLDLSKLTPWKSKLVDGRLFNPTHIAIEGICFIKPPAIKLVLVWNGMQLFIHSPTDTEWIEYDCSNLAPKNWVTLLGIMLKSFPLSILFVWNLMPTIRLWSLNHYQTLEQKRIFYLGLKSILNDNNGLVIVLRQVKNARYSWGGQHTPFQASVIAHHCDQRINLKIKSPKEICQDECIRLPLSE